MPDIRIDLTEDQLNAMSDEEWDFIDEDGEEHNAGEYQ